MLAPSSFTYRDAFTLCVQPSGGCYETHVDLCSHTHYEMCNAAPVGGCVCLWGGGGFLACGSIGLSEHVGHSKVLQTLTAKGENQSNTVIIQDNPLGPELFQQLSGCLVFILLQTNRVQLLKGHAFNNMFFPRGL